MPFGKKQDRKIAGDDPNPFSLQVFSYFVPASLFIFFTLCRLSFQTHTSLSESHLCPTCEWKQAHTTYTRQQVHSKVTMTGGLVLNYPPLAVEVANHRPGMQKSMVIFCIFLIFCWILNGSLHIINSKTNYIERKLNKCSLQWCKIRKMQLDLVIIWAWYTENIYIFVSSFGPFII